VIQRAAGEGSDDVHDVGDVGHDPLREHRSMTGVRTTPWPRDPQRARRKVVARAQDRRRFHPKRIAASLDRVPNLRGGARPVLAAGRCLQRFLWPRLQRKWDRIGTMDSHESVPRENENPLISRGFST
jgi:hypothetical protein